MLLCVHGYTSKSSCQHPALVCTGELSPQMALQSTQQAEPYQEEKEASVFVWLRRCVPGNEVGSEGTERGPNMDRYRSLLDHLGKILSKEFFSKEYWDSHIRRCNLSV